MVSNVALLSLCLHLPCGVYVYLVEWTPLGHQAQLGLSARLAAQNPVRPRRELALVGVPAEKGGSGA